MVLGRLLGLGAERLKTLRMKSRKSDTEFKIPWCEDLPISIISSKSQNLPAREHHLKQRTVATQYPHDPMHYTYMWGIVDIQSIVT